MALLMAERGDPLAPTLFGTEVGDDGVGGGPTLDETIVGAWEGLAAQVAVACPLCDEGTLRPLAAPDRGDASGGCCDRCGALLA